VLRSGCKNFHVKSPRYGRETRRLLAPLLAEPQMEKLLNDEDRSPMDHGPMMGAWRGSYVVLGGRLGSAVVAECATMEHNVKANKLL